LVFLFVGWLWLFLYILPVYLGVPYAFYKIFLLIKKKSQYPWKLCVHGEIEV
jgi:hypothetical protein